MRLRFEEFGAEREITPPAGGYTSSTADAVPLPLKGKVKEGCGGDFGAERKRRDEGIQPYGCKGFGALPTLSAEILRCARNDMIFRYSRMRSAEGGAPYGSKDFGAFTKEGKGEKMGGYSHRYWMCPYYSKDDRLKINCEGGTSIKFPDRKAITKFADDYCCAMPGWEKCSVAAMLNRHYDEMPSANIPNVYISGGGRENNRYLPQ